MGGGGALLLHDLGIFHWKHFSANYKTLDFGRRCQENALFGTRIWHLRCKNTFTWGGGTPPFPKFLDPPLLADLKVSFHRFIAQIAPFKMAEDVPNDPTRVTDRLKNTLKPMK